MNPATGEIVAPADTLTVDQLVECEYTSACPAALSAEHLGNELIGATWSHFGVPDTSTWAVDSYLLVSHYSARSWGDAATMEFPDAPAATTRTPATGQPKARKPRGGRQPSTGTKTAAVNAHNDWANTQPDAPPSPNGSRKRPAAGPTAPGPFTRYDRAFPQIGPDGRLIHTLDPVARNGFRGADASRRTEIVNGRDKHAFVAAGKFCDGTAFPAFVRAYALRPGNDSKTAAALDLVDLALRGGAVVETNAIDLGYIDTDPQVLAIPMAQRGVSLASDHKEHQHRCRVHARGVLEIDGGFFTSGTPTRLRTLGRFVRNMRQEDRRKLTTGFDERAVFMFRTNGTTSSGARRFRGQPFPTAWSKTRSGLLRPLLV